MDPPSAQLLADWSRGDEAAAEELFKRYIGRLTALARGRISGRLGRRLDADDVAHSAFRSFFVRAREGKVRLEHSGSLWRLLAAIALHKLHRQAQQHGAAKRSMLREQPLHSDVDGILHERLAGSRTATAAEAAIVAEEFERFLAELSPLERTVLELRMQDYPQSEIASLVGSSERTVRRILTDLQRRLERRLIEPQDGSESPTPRSRAASECADWPAEEPKSEVAMTDNSVNATRNPIPHVASTLGDWLSDRDFLLARHLGTGGSGKVYQAWWRSARKWVAVKILKKRNQAAPEAVEQFLREAIAVSQLRHSGIVPIHGIGRLKAGGYFLVLDLVPGGDLSSVMNKRKIEISEALRWVAEAAVAVDHAHRHGVIHCDLKPSNLLLDSVGAVRVSDFGLAHLVYRSGARPALAGTLGFMAPEQIDPSRGKIGPHTDIFGLGAVLFALLTGQPPFTAVTRQNAASRQQRGLIPSVRTVRAEFPEEVDSLCRRCLAAEIAKRVSTGAELARLLRKLI